MLLASADAVGRARSKNRDRQSDTGSQGRRGCGAGRTAFGIAICFGFARPRTRRGHGRAWQNIRQQGLAFDQAVTRGQVRGPTQSTALAPRVETLGAGVAIVTGRKRREQICFVLSRRCAATGMANPRSSHSHHRGDVDTPMHEISRDGEAGDVRPLRRRLHNSKLARYRNLPHRDADAFRRDFLSNPKLPKRPRSHRRGEAASSPELLGGRRSNLR